VCTYIGTGKSKIKVKTELYNTRFSSQYFTPNLSGDMAAVRGMVKVLLDRHEVAPESGKQVFDISFIEKYRLGLDAYLVKVKVTTWSKS
jgi:hypothetical protein